MSATSVNPPPGDATQPAGSRPAPVSVVSAEPALVRVRRELDAIIDISRAVSSTLHIDALLLRIMERTTDLMQADRSTLFVVDAEKGELWSKVMQGNEPHTITLRIGDGIAGWVAEHNQGMKLDDVYTDARFDKTWDEKSGYRTRSLLCVPITDKDGDVVAVIQCLNKRGRGFDAEDEHLLACIGTQCAVAIENAFLYASLAHANAELQVLYDVEQEIAGAHDLHTMLSGVLERLQTLMKVELAALLLCNANGSQVFSLRRDTPSFDVRAVDARETQQLLLHAQLPVARYADESGAVAELLIAKDTALDVRETYSAPVFDGRVLIGVLQVGNRVRKLGAAALDIDEPSMLRLLALVSAQLARGIVALHEREAGERAERLALLGHSVGAILHDMRTPLTAVAGYVELMTAEPSTEVRREHAARVGRALEHMEAMTHEVLSFARGQREVLIGKVYLNKFVEEVREMLVPETARAGVTLEVEAKYDGVARFDESKVKRVIFNLARNACQAMGRGGHFRWTIDRVGEQLVFECADTGPGIPKEMEGRLFESFATHGKTGGTGLGLAMAKKIIDAHCGQIGVRSRPGHGATFRIEIPL